MANELPPRKDPTRGLTRLHDLDPTEISLVPTGANRRKFLVYKNSQGKPMHAQTAVIKGGPGSGPRPGEKGHLGYHNGDQVEHTGNSKTISGATFHEAKFTEGHRQGQTVHIMSPEDRARNVERNKSELRGTGHPTPQLDSAGKPLSNIKKSALTTEGRNQINDSNFAMPKERKYPIEDVSHARNALARASGKPEEAQVKAAVYKRYPELKPETAAKAGATTLDDEEDALEDGEEVAKKPTRTMIMGVRGQHVKDLVSKTDPKLMSQVEDCYKSYTWPSAVKKDGANADVGVGDDVQAELDDQTRAAGKAVVRILSPFKGRLPPDLAHRLVDMAGFSMSDEELGLSQPTNNGGSTVIKEGKGERVSTTDNAPDLSGVDPKVREQLELVFKSQRELVAKNAELEGKNAELRKEVDTQKAEGRKKELVAKAAGWSHLALPQESIVLQLELADKTGSLELVEKSFTALNEQAQKGKLFSEVGSSLPGASAASGDAWGKIEAAAQGWVAKSGATCTKAEATDRFLQTAEGQKMYGDYKAGRKDGI